MKMASIKNRIKNFIIRLIPKSLSNEIVKRSEAGRQMNNFTFSQEGEDKVLQRFLAEKENGFYIDIGAHHPIKFSNTHLFYLKGWHGINIDAMPGSMELFNLLRPHDINLEVPVSDKKQFLAYYIFNEPALNTFSPEEAKKKNGLRDYRIINTINLETFPLSSVLDKYLPPDTNIDFLNIDVEGFDYAVLQSNNWDKYQPTIILIESLHNTLEDLHNNEIYNYLRTLNYKLVAKTFNTMFFKRGQ